MAISGHSDHVKALIVFFAVLVAMENMHINGVNADDSQVPCFFVFGDSLADNGNNNLLLTLAKVNYRPYGIDFPSGVPTGRFTNGLTTVDVIGQLLGFKDLIPSVATARGNTILKGLNYASGGSGIRDESGQHMGVLLPSMNRQLNSHKISESRINDLLGGIRAGKEYLKKCIYHVAMGNNDYLNNYFLPQFYPTSRFFTPRQYAQALVDQYRGQITRLYEMGARKVVLSGLGPIGCTPFAITTFGRNASGCADIVNDASQLFNDKLADLVDELNSKYADAQFIYINLVGIASGDPISLGFSAIDKPCCPIVDISGLCQPFSEEVVCQERDTYVRGIKLIATYLSHGFSAIDKPCCPIVDISGLCQPFSEEVVCQDRDTYVRGIKLIATYLSHGFSAIDKPCCPIVEISGLCQPFSEEVVCQDRDTYVRGIKLIATYLSHGFSVIDKLCCPIVDISGLCQPFSEEVVCQDRDTYVFWDNYHPTQRVHSFIASRSYTSLLPSDTHPMDIKRLAQLQL